MVRVYHGVTAVHVRLLLMIRVERLYISPVKSLGLSEISSAYLDKPGIAGDRAFFLVDSGARLVTQREHGRLVQINATYDVPSDVLELTFPDGTRVRGVVELSEPVAAVFFGEHSIDGRLVRGSWSEALSEFARRELRLVKADVAGRSFDAFPLSMCSLASLKALATAAGREDIDGRRFRQNIYLAGAAAHEEDTWIGGEVRAGEALLRVKMADPRCVMTTLSPDTGAQDMDTLKIIASYRADQPKDVNFGVYCTVAEPGNVRVGEEVLPVASR